MNVTATVSRTDDKCEGDKRTHVPYKIDYTCLSCGAKNTVDLSNDSYFSYPEWGEKSRFFTSCDECEAEYMIEAVPDVTLRDVVIREEEL